MGHGNTIRMAVLGLAALLLSACAGNGAFRQALPAPPPPDPVSPELRALLDRTGVLVFTHAMPEAKVMEPVGGKAAGVTEAAIAINGGDTPSVSTPKGWYAWLGGIATGPAQADAARDVSKGRGTAWYVLSDPEIPAKLSARFTRELRGEGVRAKRIYEDHVVSHKDMVMLVQVEHLALEGDESALNPELRLRVWGHAALVGPARHVLKDRSFDYMSENGMHLTEWTRDDGAPLNAEVDAALKDIAQQVTGSMFPPATPLPDQDQEGMAPSPES